MRTTTTVFIASMTFLVGLAVFPTISFVSGFTVPRWDHKCVAGGGMCVGMKAQQALRQPLAEDRTGGLISVSCGFTEPGAGAAEDTDLASVLERGCGGRKYVASLSDGRRLVNLWVDQGVILRIDDYARHAIDP